MMGLFTGAGSISEFFTNPAQWWDYFKNGRTNTVNQEIANQNLFYQMQRNAIEDARYTDETAYNRAFAEDEREYNRTFAEDERSYNRALQQELFNREDTAIERQAESLSKMGINPLSQNLNGLGAGQAVTSTLPSSINPPSLSSRGGNPLHNDFKMQDAGMMSVLSALGGLADVVNGISSGTYQRDSLALENDRKYLENMRFANDMGLNYTLGLGSKHSNYRDTKGEEISVEDSFGNKEKWTNLPYAQMSRESSFDEKYEKHRDFMYKVDHDLYKDANPKINFMNEIATMDFPKLAENIMTNIAKTGNFIGEKFKNDYGENSPFMKFFSKFF